MRAEVARRVGAGVVTVVGVWTAVTLVGGGTWALVGDGLLALLGDGSLSTAGDAFAAVRHDGLPALVLALGLVPAGALVLGAAARPGSSSRTRRLVVGMVAAAGVLLVVGLLAVTSDPTALRLATVSSYFALGSPRMLAGVWLSLVAVGVGTAAVGVLVRRRGAVVAGAAVVGVGALAVVVSTAWWGAWTIRSLGRYRGGPTSATFVLRDGSLAVGVVAGVALLVAGWCVGAAWRRLVDWTSPRPDERPEVRVARTRRRWLVAAATAVVLVVGIGAAVTNRVAAREPVPDVVADPALATCLEQALGVGHGKGVAPAQYEKVYTLDCAWNGSGPQVRSLAGLEQFTQVQDVDLSRQDVADLGPLAALTRLTSVRLTSNARVTDVSALHGLPVQNLGLSGTSVSDLGPLTGTRTLRWVGLSGTGVSDLRPLSASNLYELDVSGAAVVDLSPLAGAPELSKLDARDNQVADVGALAGMPALDELWIGGNPVADLRPLLGAPALLGVDVEGLDPATPGIAELRAQGVYVGGLA
ncbi:hypothetical protein [Cellulomonas sp.]|uniref:leucine-rich repeat domain-containing protein n=1 Tax=Cellulomonas sp. TaxID=40001 RepID=UPI001B024E81|nr:hypothetical protein [Cellulomonas sp.]MBO9555852.1 hypothetical protein [Cellulomonas sp.]